VEVPISHFHIDEHELNVLFELRPLLIKAQPCDQNALYPTACRKRRKHASRMSGAQLVNLDAVTLQQRLFKLKLQSRQVRRIQYVEAGTVRRVGEILILCAERDTCDTTSWQWFEQRGRERCGLAVIETVQPLSRLIRRAPGHAAVPYRVELGERCLN